MILLSALPPSPWLETLGRLHVAMVHLPIALLLVAGLIELWRLIRGVKGPSPTAITCVILGACSAVLASIFGWIHAAYQTYAGPQAHAMEIHRWLGVATSAVAVIAAFLILRRRENASPIYRLSAVTAALLVGITGHFGGNLTHGSGYLTELLFPKKAPAPIVLVSAPSTQPSALTFDFARDVHPIFVDSCYECHGPTAHKGGLRLDSPAEFLAGGNSGAIIVPGKSAQSLLIQRILGQGNKKRMPVDHPPLSDAQIHTLTVWINEGAHTDYAGPIKHKWIATLEPVRPDVPGPIDYLLAKYYDAHHFTPPAPVDDRTYARRVYLDVVGMLPTPLELDAFLADKSADKRHDLVKKLLADDRRYAENWLTFWNDALRNDYNGPGYIDGGRRQITNWLYHALATNMPYDKFVAQLINPVPESEGFAKGIIWRGAVSASQRPELQAAQNISQVFMGINMKCNSCHDSFISDWKLADAYGLAGIYSDSALEMYRCEVPLGKNATIKFMYPQLGSIDGAAPKKEKMREFATLMTCPRNGRLSRTIVNRLWARFLGRGIVEPVDEMDNEPWNPQLLDALAIDLQDNNYNLKHTIYEILTSKAYQLPSVGMADPSEKDFTFHGPVVRRMSAEQFCDATAQITDVWTADSLANIPELFGPPGKYIWDTPAASHSADDGPMYFRKIVELPNVPAAARVATIADNSVVLYINGHEVASSKDWAKPGVADITSYLVAGKNIFAAKAINGTPASTAPTAENPAAFWMLASLRDPSQNDAIEIVTDATWKCSKRAAAEWQDITFDDTAWKPAAELTDTPDYNLLTNLIKSKKSYRIQHVRSCWSDNDALMTALGRPDREQVVTYRPTAATTLQALELTNGPELTEILHEGAKHWLAEKYPSDQDRIAAIYRESLGRAPTDQESKDAQALLAVPATQSTQPSNPALSTAARENGIEDLLWSILMLPEYQLIY
jgi:uncharacterized membrane protein